MDMTDTDILDRLRAIERAPSRPSRFLDQTTAREAADEIERLRKIEAVAILDAALRKSGNQDRGRDDALARDHHPMRCDVQSRVLSRTGRRIEALRGRE